MALSWLRAVAVAGGLCSAGPRGLLVTAFLGPLAMGACGRVSPAPLGTVGANLDSGAAARTSSPSDASVDASACLPGDVETFVAPAYRPAIVEDACVAQDGGDPVTLYYDACLGPAATPAACLGVQSEYSACAACIATPIHAAAYGPLVVDVSGVARPNRAGCVELATAASDPAAGIECAKAVQAQSNCEIAACEANCPVTNSPSGLAYDECAQTADDGGCAVFSSAATACLGAQDSGDASICATTDFYDFYIGVVRLFCSAAPPLDAGQPSDGAASNDGRSDAPADAPEGGDE
ncbi:MAG: hypothetical protein ABSC94_16090 [Polyangiaceae bacterium]